jgi:hypothetical protein
LFSLFSLIILLPTVVTAVRLSHASELSLNLYVKDVLLTLLVWDLSLVLALKTPILLACIKQNGCHISAFLGKVNGKNLTGYPRHLF